MTVPTFEYTAASGKRFRAVTLQALLEAAGLNVPNPRAIYGARGSEQQGIPIVLLEPIEQNRTEQHLDENEVLAILGKVLKGRTSPVDAARVLAAASGQKRGRGRPRKTG